MEWLKFGASIVGGLLLGWIASLVVLGVVASAWGTHAAYTIYAVLGPMGTVIGGVGAGWMYWPPRRGKVSDQPVEAAVLPATARNGYCARCGASVTADQSFCGSCGQALAEHSTGSGIAVIR